MDLFKKIRDKYPLIEENDNMFKLFLILRSINSTIFRKLTQYMFFDIAEYLFFDEYAAEKLYLVKLYNMCSNIHFHGERLAPLTIKDALSIPIEQFLYVTSVYNNGLCNRLDLQNTFSFQDLPPNRNNYMKIAVIYIDQPHFRSRVFDDFDTSNWGASTWRRVEIIQFRSQIHEPQPLIETLHERIWSFCNTILNRTLLLEYLLEVNKENKPKKRKFYPCRKHIIKQNYKRYNSIVKGRYRK